jgi:hypothetical protein
MPGKIPSTSFPLIYRFGSKFGGDALDNVKAGYRYTKVAPDEEMVLNNGTTLYFRGAIVYEAHHYTVVFKCGSSWMHFNDMGTGGNYNQKLLHIGDKFQDILDWQNGKIMTNGTQYIYASAHSI